MTDRFMNESWDYAYPVSEVFDLLVNPEKFAGWTGGDAKCGPNQGDALEAWKGYVTGKTLACVKNHTLVQEWKGASFDKASIVTFSFERCGEKACKVTLSQDNVPKEWKPAEKREEDGWAKHYWLPMREYLDKHSGESKAAETESPKKRSREEVSESESKAESVKMNACHVDIPVKDMDRAMKFYAAVHNFSFKDVIPGDKSYMLFKGEGKDGDFPSVDGGFFVFDGELPKKRATTVYMFAPDMAATFERVKAAGGEVTEEREDLPGGHGAIGYYRDTEGNEMGVYSV